jgi:indolepyruvate decarboxylase
LPDWPFHELADSLGGVGLRVRTRRELAEALEHAVADQGRFVLIDVVMERGQMSSTLSRYVEAFERQRSQGS